MAPPICDFITYLDKFTCIPVTNGLWSNDCEVSRSLWLRLDKKRIEKIFKLKEFAVNSYSTNAPAKAYTTNFSLQKFSGSFSYFLRHCLAFQISLADIPENNRIYLISSGKVNAITLVRERCLLLAHN